MCVPACLHLDQFDYKQLWAQLDPEGSGCIGTGEEGGRNREEGVRNRRRRGEEPERKGRGTGVRACVHGDLKAQGAAGCFGFKGLEASASGRGWG